MISFGFFLSIEQGFTVVLGTLSNGVLRGADVLMPVDLAIYAIFIVVPPQKVVKKYVPLFYFSLFCILAFWLWSFSGEFISIEPADFRFGFVHLTRSVLVFLCIIYKVNTKRAIIDFTIGLLLALGLQVIIGVWQWQIGPVSLPFFNIVNTYRVTGTIGVANAYGLYVAALLPIAIRIALFTRLKPKWLWYFITSLSLGALLASYTRGAWLSFILATIFFFIIDYKEKKISRRQLRLLLGLGTIVIIFVAVKYGHVIENRMVGSTETLASDKKHSRIGLAKDAIGVISENKIWGVGLNNYRYHSDKETQGTRIVHNTYLLIAAQQGVPGIIIFLFLNITIFLSGFKILKTKDGILYHIGIAHLTGLLIIFMYYMGAPDYRLVIIKLQHWRNLAMVLATLLVIERQNLALLYKAKLNRMKRRAR